MIRYGTVLALGAHTDDIELGCGGLLSRLKNEGSEIKTLVFSKSEASLPDSFPRDTLSKEFYSSMSVLGLQDGSTVLDFPVRKLAEFRQEILEEIIAVRKEYNPDLVLTINSKDSHQDHSVIHIESVRAFRNTNLIGYELPWNQSSAIHNMFVEISEKDLDAKIAMIMRYESQIILKRPYISPDYVRSAALFRGYQAKMPLAEAYEVINQNWRLE